MVLYVDFMAFLSFITDIIFLSFLHILGFLLAKIPQKVEAESVVAEEVLEVEPEPITDAKPEYSWALSEKERVVIPNNITKKVERSGSQPGFLILLALLFFILISPIAIFIAKINPISYLISLLLFVIVYIWQNSRNLIDLDLKLKNIFSLLPQINKASILNHSQNLKDALLLQPKIKLIYFLLIFDAVYLDLFIAKVSLDKTAATAYTAIS